MAKRMVGGETRPRAGGYVPGAEAPRGLTWPLGGAEARAPKLRMFQLGLSKRDCPSGIGGRVLSLFFGYIVLFLLQGGR